MTEHRDIKMTPEYHEVSTWLNKGDEPHDSQEGNSLCDLITEVVAERLIAGRKEHERGLGVEKKSERLVAVNPGATEFDSVVLAKVLKYMAVLEEKELSQSQIQCILYIAYGVRLAQRDVRLMAEHPRMWRYGPVFPRVYKALQKDTDDGFCEYDAIRREHPAIFRYMTNCFRRFAWTKACILVSPHIADGSPWADTRKSNPDSWGARIEDSLIREWFLPRV